MSPLISICIPAYNATRYLPATLATVRAQTFSHWELIVTEDGSREPSGALVQAFAGSVPQPVTYQQHVSNLGLPSTRNTGISTARGEWIALLDADDLWQPDHLERLLACVQQYPKADFVHAGSVLFASDTGEELATRAPTPAAIRNYPRSLYLGEYLVQPSAALLKKSLWARVGGFNPAFRYVEDHEMWLRCARAGAVFAYSGRNTCRYRKHATALTTHAGPMALASAAVLQQHLDWKVIPVALRRRHTAEAWVSAGRIVLRSTPLLARDCFSRAWRIRPTPRIAAYWAAAWLHTIRKADDEGARIRLNPPPRQGLPH